MKLKRLNNEKILGMMGLNENLYCTKTYTENKKRIKSNLITGKKED